MTPTTYQLKVYRGDTYRWRFRLWQDAAMTIPTDITGTTATAEIRDRPTNVLYATMACTVTSPNIIDMVLDAADSSILENAFWDLQITYPSGDVATVVSGTVFVTADITGSLVA